MRRLCWGPFCLATYFLHTCVKRSFGFTTFFLVPWTSFSNWHIASVSDPGLSSWIWRGSWNYNDNVKSSCYMKLYSRRTSCGSASVPAQKTVQVWRWGSSSHLWSGSAALAKTVSVINSEKETRTPAFAELACVFQFLMWSVSNSESVPARLHWRNTCCPDYWDPWRSRHQSFPRLLLSVFWDCHHVLSCSSASPRSLSLRPAFALQELSPSSLPSYFLRSIYANACFCLRKDTTGKNMLLFQFWERYSVFF